MVRRSAMERLGFTSPEALPRTIHIGERDIPLPEGANWTVLDDEADSSKFERATRKEFAVGQLGAGFLSRFVLCVDPGHGRLGLGDPKEFDLQPGDARWVPLLMMPGGENHPFVHLLLLDNGTLAGGYGVLFDTGATTSMLDRNKIDFQRGKHPDWPTANGAFGDADMIAGQGRRPFFHVGDVALNTPGPPPRQRGVCRRRPDLHVDLGYAGEDDGLVSARAPERSKTMERTTNILLVDDDEICLMNLRRAFQKGKIADPLFYAEDGS